VLNGTVISLAPVSFSIGVPFFDLQDDVDAMARAIIAIANKILVLEVFIFIYF
jgi:hypothetical protein